MSKYNIEGGIDFFSELYKSLDIEENEQKTEEDNNDSELVTETNDNKQKQVGGLIIKEINKSGTILVYSRLDADKFDKYKYNSTKKKITIGVNLDNLLIILKCMSNLDQYVDINYIYCWGPLFESKKDRTVISVLNEIKNHLYENYKDFSICKKMSPDMKSINFIDYNKEMKEEYKKLLKIDKK